MTEQCNPTDRAAILELYGRMLASAEEGDDEAMMKRIDEARARGWELDVEDEEEEPTFEGGYATVDVLTKLLLGKEVVAEWESSYSGSWGGGAGWWVGCDHTGIPDEVAALLECAEIRLCSPDIPKPPLEAEEEAEDEGGEDVGKE